MPPWRQRKWLILLSAGLLAFATLVPMSPGQDELPFPWFKCPYRQLTGKLCPLCGSTRAFTHTAHRHFADALELSSIELIAYFATWGLLSSHAVRHLREWRDA
ncbi:MAG TPA: DUF2752 domain-containing protein [Candidatus Korarchaeota archaeon]|nr:DUF2752 domain-containing protein [Candidatus Korarchaeota archaeon]